VSVGQVVAAASDEQERGHEAGGEHDGADREGQPVTVHQASLNGTVAGNEVLSGRGSGDGVEQRGPQRAADLLARVDQRARPAGVPVGDPSPAAASSSPGANRLCGPNRGSSWLVSPAPMTTSAEKTAPGMS
jgi:hypothetical protein